MEKLTALYVKSVNKMNGLVQNERGSQTLEWIGIAAVVVIAVGVISTAFSGGDFGNTVKDKFVEFIDKIG